MSNNLAPIGVSTYVRLEHLRQTIAALQKNRLAQQSKLYVFSDAPRDGDEVRVEAVRNYLLEIDGFKDIHIIERGKNNRVDNNHGGMRMLLDRYGKMIFLEEDVVTAPGFLTFMNQGLDEYEGNDRIFSVVGYCPPIKIPASYQDDIFVMRRFSGWGFGIWKNRYDSNKYIKPDQYEKFAANKKQVSKFVKGGGKDMMKMLKAEAYGQIDAWDVKAMYTQFLNNQYTVYPTRSLTMNIGHDGTGMHCVKTDKFNVTLSDKTTFRFPDKLSVDPRIVRANLIFREWKVEKSLRERVVGELRRVIKRILG